MAWYKSIHGDKLKYDDTNLYLHGRPVGNSIVGQGQTFYVDSGVDRVDGTSPDSAVGTLDEALAKCTASRGDTIVVMPGHAETVASAAAIDVDIIGVRIIGLGHGSLQPQFTFTAAGSTFDVSVADVLLQNLRFTSSVDSVAVGLDILAAATDVHVVGCRFDVDAAGTDEFDISVQINAGCDGAVVKDCHFDMDLADAVAAISITGASDRVSITGNKVFGDYSTANINGITTLSTNVDIGGNLLLNGEGGDLNAQPGIELVTGSTGIIYDNYIVCNLATKAASVVADTCLLFENYYNEDISGAATGGIIGTASADDV